MLNIGNQLLYSYSVYNPNFRQSSNVTKPNLEINNIGGDSLQALASYNVAQLGLDNKIKNSILKPFQVPSNIDEIKGERIYNSDGKLVEIVDEDDKYKTIYRFNDNISYNMIKTDKKTNIIYQQILNGDSLCLDKKLPNGKILSTVYENNVPVQIDEYFYSDDKDQTITYLPKDNYYSIQQHFDNKDGKISRVVHFDKDGNCESTSEYADKQNRRLEINLYNGKPYSITTTSNETIENDINVDNIDLTHLEPYPYYNVDYNQILNTEGKKKYYSNGKLEKLIANDGKIYHFNLSGELTLLENKDYRIVFYTKEDTICSSFEPKGKGQRVEMSLENGGEIVIQNGNYNGSIWTDVFYENSKTGEDKSATYKDGKLMSYNNFNKNGFSVEYDDNGNVCNIQN